MVGVPYFSSNWLTGGGCVGDGVQVCEAMAWKICSAETVSGREGDPGLTLLWIWHRHFGPQPTWNWSGPGGDEAAGWKKSGCGTAKDGRHPLWPLRTSMLLVLVFAEISMWVYVCVVGRGGWQTGRREKGRKKRDSWTYHSQRLGGGGPQRGKEGPGRWVGKVEGECHPIEQLFPRPLDI